MILLIKCIYFTFLLNSSLHHQISFRFPSNFHFLLFSFQLPTFPFGRKFPSKWKPWEKDLFDLRICNLSATLWAIGDWAYLGEPQHKYDCLGVNTHLLRRMLKTTHQTLQIQTKINIQKLHRYVRLLHFQKYLSNQ